VNFYLIVYLQSTFKTSQLVSHVSHILFKNYFCSSVKLRSLHVDVNF